MKKNIDRFYKSKWGVFSHYLNRIQNNPNFPNSYRLETDWNTCVHDFDVKLMARQLHELGAGYYFITLMQGSAHMLAPNSTFDKIAGTKPGEVCSTRDLPMELADELAKYGIDLYLYFTGDGPYQHEEIGKKFGFVESRFENLNDEFIEKWASVLEEYAVRYGDKVKGWWIDGCYDYFQYTNERLIPYKKAIEKGNPDAIVTFNNGELGGFRAQWDNEDYICGEATVLLRQPLNGRFENGKQNHILAPIGNAPHPCDRWGAPFEPLYDEDYLFDYFEAVLQKGAVVTIDIATFRDGHFDPEQYVMLKKAYKRYLEKYGDDR